MRDEPLPQLRQALRKQLDGLADLVAPAFEREPTFPGNVNTWQHTCGRSGCHCQRGEKHTSTRLTIAFQGGAADRSLSESDAPGWRERTEAYRRMRGAMRELRRWSCEVAALLDAIERARRCTEGLSEEDAQRPLR